MFSTGEFARLGAVSIRTLRHYDEIGLLRPAEVDPVTGYRSYAPKQLRQLNRIVALKDLGLTLEQIRRLLDGVTAAQLPGMLVALPVAEEPAELPDPAQYTVLPAIKAISAVRSGPAASIFPMVCQDLTAWAEAHGYQPTWPAREIWIHEVDDISEIRPAGLRGPAVLYPVSRAAPDLDQLSALRGRIPEDL